VIPAARRAELAAVLGDKISAIDTIDRLAKAAGLAPRNFKGASALDRWTTVLERLDEEKVTIETLLAGIRKEFPLTASRVEDLLDDPVVEAAGAQPTARTVFPRPIVVSRIDAPDTPVSCIRWPWKKQLKLAIRVGARASDSGPPTIEVSSPTAKAKVKDPEPHGEWWATTATIATGRLFSQTLRVTLAGDDVSEGRLIVACRGPSYAGSIVLLVASALCAFVLFLALQGTGESWTAISGVLPLVVGVAAAVNLARPRLLRDGRLQQPEYAFPAAGLLVLFAFIPGFMFVAIDNRTGEDVSVDGKSIAKNSWITGDDDRVEKLRVRYCVSAPSRNTGRFLDLFLPRVIVKAKRATWDALSNDFTDDERATLKVESGGSAIEGEFEVLVDTDDDCRVRGGAAVRVDVENASIRVPYNRRLTRKIVEGVPDLRLEPAEGSGDVKDDKVVVTDKGALHCIARGDVPLSEYVTEGARVLRLVTTWPGNNSSSWTGGDERAWSCAPEKVASTQLDLETDGGPVEIVLPSNPGASTVKLDGVKVICHPEVGKLWRIMRLPLADNSKVPGDPVRFGAAAEATLVVTPDRFAVICASNEMEPSFTTATYKITIGDNKVAISARTRPPSDQPRPPDVQPVKKAERFCYYVKDQSPTGPCLGDTCPSGCKATRDPLKKAGALRGCSRVCACVTAPRCVQ
jgi:hypothetical protein